MQYLRTPERKSVTDFMIEAREFFFWEFSITVHAGLAVEVAEPVVSTDGIALEAVTLATLVCRDSNPSLACL